ncbi:hypothetical protein N0V93_009177 [Gnomoniopsis smithogilvyi]|uniref:Intradiol ring-cleavage dioxygenases domain-containing protein n=1 Tax=Gnomoniopsis smithogilvyi TaxID=1191159 RepID=A0A9W8YJ71_9PEZI|nr:hypothetical protein N0V93_009177 [Gnomoniopsis smithogilvyi]
MHSSAVFVSWLVAFGLVAAHPGHSVEQELAERQAGLANSPRSLNHCAAKIKARGLEARNVQRRSAWAASHGKTIAARDADTVLATDHNETSLGYTLETDEATLFSSNSSCILSPIVTQGPYYVEGEYVRSDIVEDQEGVALHLETQVYDYNTCEPVEGAYVEIWHCNSTGVYSGIVASGNGDSSDTSNLDKTFLRGVSVTDDEGVVTFDTLLPGHYLSRTNHIHAMVHLNATPLANGTLYDLQASAVTQIFFDQTLVDAVEATDYYNTNTQAITTNAEDSIFLGEANDDTDPVASYTLLGDDVTDGLLAWLAFGIDTSVSTTIKPAAVYYESGGVDN